MLIPRVCQWLTPTELCADHNPLGIVVQFLIHLTVCLSDSISPSTSWDDVEDSVKILTWSLHLHSSKWWRLSGCLSTIFLFTNLWWLQQIIFLLFICLWILSRVIWFIILSVTEVKLTGLQFAGSSFLKRGTMSFLTPLKKLFQLLPLLFQCVFRVLRVATQLYWSLPSALVDVSRQVPHSFWRICCVCLNAL